MTEQGSNCSVSKVGIALCRLQQDGEHRFVLLSSASAGQGFSGRGGAGGGRTERSGRGCSGGGAEWEGGGAWVQPLGLIRPQPARPQFGLLWEALICTCNFAGTVLRSPTRLPVAYRGARRHLSPCSALSYCCQTWGWMECRPTWLPELVIVRQFRVYPVLEVKQQLVVAGGTEAS